MKNSKKSLQVILKLLLTIGSYSSFAQNIECNTNALDIQFVKPELSPTRPGKIKKFLHKNLADDPFAAKVKDGYAQMQSITLPEGKFYVLNEINEGSVDSIVVNSLRNSKEFKESLKLRYCARELAKSLNNNSPLVFDQTNDPVYITFSDDLVYGLGPVFLDTTNFLVRDINGKLKKSNNLILLEEAKLFGKDFITTSTLIRNGRIGVVMAHENAHGLMQDLYGVENFKKFYENIASTNGHDVVITSDSAISFFEGFAIAFEAYLWEKFYPLETKKSVQQFDNPFLMLSFDIMTSGGTFADRFASYVQLISGKDDMGNMLSRYMEVTRTEPVISNQFMLEETMGLDVYKKGYLEGKNLYSLLDGLEIASPTRALMREGVIAHQFYKLLKADKFMNIITVLTKHKPLSYKEFYLKYIQEFPNDHYALSEAAFKSFSIDANQILSTIYKYDRDQSNFNLKLAKDKENFIIHQNNISNFDEFLKKLLEQFPEVELFNMGMKFSYYEKDIEEKIDLHKEGKLTSKYSSLQEIMDAQNQMNKMFDDRRSKLYNLLDQKFITEFEDNNMSDFIASLNAISTPLWLELKIGYGLRRNLLDKGIKRIDLNSANEGEIQSFLKDLYSQVKDIKGMQADSYLESIQESIKDLFSGAKLDEAIAVTDIIIENRAKYNGNFKNIQQAFEGIPEAWRRVLNQTEAKLNHAH